MAESDISFTALADFQPLTWYNLDSQKVFKRIYYVSDDGNSIVATEKNDIYNRLYIFKKSILNNAHTWTKHAYISISVSDSSFIYVFKNIIIIKDNSMFNLLIYKYDISNGQYSLLNQYSSTAFNTYTKVLIRDLQVSDDGSTICYAGYQSDISNSFSVYCSKNYC